MNRKKSIIIATLLVMVLVVCGAAQAQLAGIRATVDAADYGSGAVDITGTIFYAPSGFSTAWMGDSSGFGTNANAVEWGDGSVVAPIYPTGIPFDTTSTPTGAPGPVFSYRMAFSHNYGGDPSGNIITVASHAQYFSSGNAFTGNTAYFQTPTYSIFGGIRTVLTNTVALAAPTVPVIEIPTVSQFGMLLLALALVGAAIPLLRR